MTSTELKSKNRTKEIKREEQEGETEGKSGQKKPIEKSKKKKKRSKEKVFFMSKAEVEAKKVKIQKKIEDLKGSENKKKRANWYKVTLAKPNSRL